MDKLAEYGRRASDNDRRFDGFRTGIKPTDAVIMMLGNDALFYHERLRKTSVLLVLGYLTRQIADNYSEAARLEPEKWKGIGGTKITPKKLTKEEKKRIFAEGMKRVKEEAARNGR